MPSTPSTRGILSRRNRFIVIGLGAIATIAGFSWSYYKLLDSPTPTALDPCSKTQNAASATQGISSPKKLNPPSVKLAYTLTEDSSSLHSVAISPDGQNLISSSDFSNVKVWNLDNCTGTQCNTPKQILPMYALWSHSVAISPDGKIVASGSWNDIKFWDLNSGKLIKNIFAHLGAVYSVVFNPQGQTLATGASDNQVKIWNLETDKLLHTLSSHSDSVRTLAFSPDGKILVSGGLDKVIKIWNVGNGCKGETCISQPKNLSGHTAYISSLTISPDGKTLVSASADQTIKIWNLQTGQLIHTLLGHCAAVLSVSINPEGTMLASGSTDKTIKFWQLSSGELLNTISGHSEGVGSVAFSPNGRNLVSASKDKTIKVWQIE